jgi:hypothetical protein
MSNLMMLSGAAPTPSLRDRISRSLSDLCAIEGVDDGVRITTHCMYPSNGLVRVTVHGGAETIVASDNGEALGEALAAGIEISDPNKLLGGFIRQRGLILRNGVISTSPAPIEAASVAVLHVANAAKEAANWLYDHGAVKRRRDFRELLSAFLAEAFRDQLSEERIVGASNKQHKFSNVISFANGHRFIVDAVANEPSSINARVVANLDIKSINDPRIEQRIVYDDAEKWSGSDLNLLQVGATVVPFSRANEVIRRVADQTRAVA